MLAIIIFLNEHIPPLFQNYHSHFIIQKKKNYLSTSLTFSQITPRIFPLSKSTKTLVPRVFRARNERPLPPIDSCRSGSRGTSRESWKLLHPCTNMHARATSLSARVVRFFHQLTKPPSLLPSCPLENDKFFDAPSVTMTSGSRSTSTFENGFPITRVPRAAASRKSSYRAV